MQNESFCQSNLFSLPSLSLLLFFHRSLLFCLLPFDQREGQTCRYCSERRTSIQKTPPLSLFPLSLYPKLQTRPPPCPRPPPAVFASSVYSRSSEPERPSPTSVSVALLLHPAPSERDRRFSRARACRTGRNVQGREDARDSSSCSTKKKKAGLTKTHVWVLFSCFRLTESEEEVAEERKSPKDGGEASRRL